MPDTFQVYESLINEELREKLSALSATLGIHKDKLEADSSGELIASYLRNVVESALRHYRTDKEDLTRQLEIANSIIALLQDMTGEGDISRFRIAEEELLRGITEKTLRPADFRARIPQTSLSHSSLFTGGQLEPPVYSELKREIASADRIDLLVSFIKHSGLRLLYDDLVKFTAHRPLRVITTSYMGASDYKAITMLASLPNTEVRISYDTARTRLHAKAYYFHRETGFSTAYIGSSNLSRAALSEGTEWNMKVSEYTSPEIVEKYRITFETYWNLSEFQKFDPQNQEDRERLRLALDQERFFVGSGDGFPGADRVAEDGGAAYGHSGRPGYFFDLKPYAYQQEILDRLEVEREVVGSHRNLIVAATGTGKTMVAAFDYKAFREGSSPGGRLAGIGTVTATSTSANTSVSASGNDSNGDASISPKPNARFLFIAHREEILRQSLKAFRGVLRDANFGEIWLGGREPREYREIFASVQTLHSGEKYRNLPPDHFDYIIMDEIHHGKAASYQGILNYFKPKILLGLTATPERMDGGNILEDFNHRIAAEIRLREAIERNLLCPFHYFGVSEDTDLSGLKWQGGRYETAGLEALYIGNHVRDRVILDGLEKYAPEIQEVKGLGFCVSKEHARYMARRFNECGIPSAALDSDSPDPLRHSVQGQLTRGEIRFIFVVDLYNEGVDIPEINTVLFLRPTESATIFIQQLGRGLRLHPGKEVLTVLDFIGQSHKSYNFRSKLQSLLGRIHHSVEREIANDFPSLPKNCAIQLERVARERILENIEGSYHNRRRLRQMVETFHLVSEKPLSLKNFLAHFSMEPQELYRFASMTELRGGRVPERPGNLQTAMSKLAKMDDRGLLSFALSYLERLMKPEGMQGKEMLERMEERAEDEGGTEADVRRLLMLHLTFWGEAPGSLDALHEEWGRLAKEYPVLLEEIRELLEWQIGAGTHLPRRVKIAAQVPLELHASYSTDQVLAALGVHTPEKKMAFREGVKYVEPLHLDVFFITLNKSERLFKESVRYEDYALNEWLFHWQSQSRTSLESPTGQRYVGMRENGSRVLLFVREEKNDAFGTTETYTCLGLADYVRHQGSQPISIVYRLREKMPIHVLRSSNQVVNIV